MFKFNFFEIIRVGTMVLIAAASVVAGGQGCVPISIKGRMYNLCLTPGALVALKEERKLLARTA